MERTNYTVPPFSSDATPEATGLSEHDIKAVKALAARIHAMPSSKHQSALVKDRDNDRNRRRAWDSWLKDRFNKWSLVQDIESVLKEENRHLRQLIGQQGFVSNRAETSLATRSLMSYSGEQSTHDGRCNDPGNQPDYHA